MAIALGFGAAALLVSPINPLTGAGHYLLFAALSAGLAAAMVSIGVLISVLSNGRTKALAIAVAVWFGLVLFYNLGAIGLAMAVSSSGQTLLMAVLGNPVESVRILAVLSLEPDLSILGPLGAYLSNEFGQRASATLLVGNVFAWAAAPLALAVYLFRRQDA
jgi:ABC-type transport system involved in multi-copper enzyme maturation permease subunit